MANLANTKSPIAGWREMPDGNRLLAMLLVAVLVVVGLAILQDFLQAARRGGAFYFSESLLFKTVWFFFPPMLMLIGRFLRSGRATAWPAKFQLVAIATSIHLLLVPPTVWLISSLFREQHYGVVKVFTFTASNDLLVMILVYTCFIFWVKPAAAPAHLAPREEKPASGSLVVGSGGQFHRIELDEILYVQSATPYVAIQVGSRQLLHLSTLASMGERLGSRFIRVHRSTCVNIDKVSSCKSRLNGDYDLTMHDGSEVRLSRNYAAAFKARFGQGPQLRP